VKIAVFGRKFDKSFESSIKTFFKIFCKKKADIHIFQPFYEFVKTFTNLDICVSNTFESFEQIDNGFDFFFSFGGDGTFLEAVRFVRDKGIPLIGINTGRLGFLANIAKEDILPSLNLLFDGKYKVEKRKLIQLSCEKNPFNDFPYALNEVTVQKKGTSMISVTAFINEEFINTYWTDGLIVSTPTGSTAYSMSVGGPVVVPSCRTVLISPIASHNLSVRPMVVPDDFNMTLKIKSRPENFLVTIDSRTCELPSEIEIFLQPAHFEINMLSPDNNSFYQTMRNKLMWGLDIRN
jgi:NAD+ kinase